MSNLQTHYHFNLDFQTVDQYTGGKGWSTVPNTAQTISDKAWNSPVEYPSRESKQGLKESEGSMFNPIFKGKALGETSREVRICWSRATYICYGANICITNTLLDANGYSIVLYRDAHITIQLHRKRFIVRSCFVVSLETVRIFDSSYKKLAKMTGNIATEEFAKFQFFPTVLSLNPTA